GLVGGKLGVPLAPHRPGEAVEACLPGLPAVAEVARTIPWSGPPRARAQAADGIRAASYGGAWLAQVDGGGSGNIVVRGAAPRSLAPGPYTRGGPLRGRRP